MNTNCRKGTCLLAPMPTIDGERLIIEKADAVPRMTHRDLVKALKKAKRELVELGCNRVAMAAWAGANQ